MTYKPLKRFREQTGILSKTVTYTMKQVTELKNSLGEPAIITFTDHVPRSQDEKLKVRCLNCPIFPAPNIGENNVESYHRWNYIQYTTLMSLLLVTNRSLAL